MYKLTFLYSLAYYNYKEYKKESLKMLWNSITLLNCKTKEIENVGTELSELSTASSYVYR